MMKKYKATGTKEASITVTVDLEDQTVQECIEKNGSIENVIEIIAFQKLERDHDYGLNGIKINEEDITDFEYEIEEVEE